MRPNLKHSLLVSDLKSAPSKIQTRGFVFISIFFIVFFFPPYCNASLPDVSHLGSVSSCLIPGYI